jgi:hypothetical protein
LERGYAIRKGSYTIDFISIVPNDLPWDVMIEGNLAYVLRGCWEERGPWIHFTTLLGAHFTVPTDAVREISSFFQKKTLWAHPALRG